MYFSGEFAYSGCFMYLELPLLLYDPSLSCLAVLLYGCSIAIDFY